MNREKVIKGLENSLTNQGCGYMDGVGELYAVSGEDLQNAIAMLKEQKVMKQCSNECTPCCDFCIHAYHEYFEDEKEGYINGFIRGGPIGCIIHYDEKHQRIAQSCGWCNDFYCFRQYTKDVT